MSTRSAALRRADLLLIAVLTAGAGMWRAVALGRPPTFVLDEDIYVGDACRYLGLPTSGCGGATTSLPEAHPPLGKWLLGWGLASDPGSPTAWRVAAVVAGAATVGLLYLLARKLHTSTLAATVAGAALALDPMHFVHSRLALLDVFVPLFAVTAVLFLVLDRERVPTEPRRIARGHPWRVAAGVAGGLALASKWSGALVLLMLWLLAVTWERSARQRAGVARPLDDALRKEGWGLIVSLVLVPLGVYAATFVGRIEGDLLALPWSSGSWTAEFFGQQWEMFRFHSGYHVDASFVSPAWSWPLLRRPATYFFEPGGEDTRWILATGNPFIWWPALGAIAWAAQRCIRMRSATTLETVVVIGFCANYLPWTVLGAWRVTWLTYLLPALPFMCLALAHAIDHVATSQRAVAAAVVGAAGLVPFAFFYPVLTAVPLSPAEIAAREWFDDCDTAGWVVRDEDGTVTRVIRSLNAPSGWCWGQPRYVAPSEL